MQVIYVNNLLGTSPFTINVCDTTLTYCYNVLTGVTSSSVSFNLPYQLDGVSQVIVKVFDNTGCEDIRFISCPTNTPTPTMTPTITPTNIDTGCLCILFDNQSASSVGIQYTDCNKVYISTFIGGNTLLSVCGSNPTADSSKVIISISDPCISGLCPPSSITLTPTPTPSITPTISITPSITPTISITPSITPTISITPSITPTNTVTPTVTKTQTPTPTVTPSRTPPPMIAYLFIEELSGKTDIGQWMFDRGQKFFGFSNASQPTQSQPTFNEELNNYVDFTGWTNGFYPSIIQQTVPQTSGGFDSFGNSILQYNFDTTQVSAGTADRAWYSWIIPINATNNLKQVQIDYSTSNPNILTTVNMESTIYNYTFTYTGTTIPNGTYRMYTTYPGTNFRLINSTDIYFRGNTVA
jgi:hypothetical protein